MTKGIKIVALLLLGSSLSGCGLYTKYQSSPDAEIVDNLYNYIETSSDTTTIASYSWREIFTDPQLQALIEQGLERNTDLNVARLNIEQAEIALRTARLAYLPSLGATASAGVSSGSSIAYNLSVSASWQIDLFGKIRNAKEMQRAALEQSEAYRQAVQSELVASIAGYYYSLLLLDEQIKISNLSLEAWQANIRSVEALNRAGRVNKTSVLQAQANKIALESSIVSLQEQLSALENSLSALLLTPAQTIERGEIASANFNEELCVGIPLQLVSNRPDVKVAEYQLMQAFYATNIARGSLYPSLTISGTAAYSSEVIYSALASLVQPIFYQGTLRAELQISKSQQEQALLAFNQAIVDAGAEVNTALIGWQSASKQRDYNEQQIELLEEALRSSELLMKHGNINYLEVLTAQQTLLTAQLNYASNRYNELQSIIDLYRALGGGKE